MPTTDAFAATGSIAITATVPMTSLTPGAGAFVAAGYLSASGIGAFDGETPGVTAFMADGSLDCFGVGTLGGLTPSPLVSAMAATGSLGLRGEGQIGGTKPGVVIATISEFAASGYIALTGAAQESAVSPPVLALSAAGGFRLGGPFVAIAGVFYPVDKTAPFAAAGAIEVGGESQLGIPQRIVTAFVADTGATGLTILIGSDSAVGFILPPVSRFRAVGGFFFEPVSVVEGVTETWVLTGQAYEPAIFTGFNFNSFALHRGHAYAAGEDGIYLLEGEDDAGQEIHTGMRLITNLGNDQEKRLRAIQFGKGGPDTNIRVEANDGGRVGYFVLGDRTNRIQISRDIQAEEFTIDVADFEQLSQFEISSFRLAKR